MRGCKRCVSFYFLVELLPLSRWSRPAQLLGMFVTWELWSLAVIFFRSPDIHTALALLRAPGAPTEEAGCQASAIGS